MKRYRILNVDFDTRANILTLPIKDEWREDVKDLWKKNKEQVRDGLIDTFGARFSENKIKNFLELGPRPISVVAFHNIFFEQVRISFVMGSYYPALTGCCALGERVLNHLILLLRDDHRFTIEYKNVYRKDSFDNWDIVIDTLSAWNVLLPEAVDKFRELMDKRNDAIHFRPDTDTNDRRLALEAIRCLQDIIGIQFSGFGLHPWFITGIPGEIYIKKSWESQPFINKVYLPNGVLVGSHHKVESVRPRLDIKDEFKYEIREITDDDFVALRNEYIGK